MSGCLLVLYAPGKEKGGVRSLRHEGRKRKQIHGALPGSQPDCALLREKAVQVVLLLQQHLLAHSVHALQLAVAHVLHLHDAVLEVQQQHRALAQHHLDAVLAVHLEAHHLPVFLQRPELQLLGLVDVHGDAFHLVVRRHRLGHAGGVCPVPPHLPVVLLDLSDDAHHVRHILACEDAHAEQVRLVEGKEHITINLLVKEQQRRLVKAPFLQEHAHFWGRPYLHRPTALEEGDVLLHRHEVVARLFGKHG
mmetsp:Transcript_33264/g.83603  ORF Transcript_33264/g.83603 Transcript_33264/m.83603 type:complete len:250 (+) Transcript_33264:2179-2928(+)